MRNKFTPDQLQRLGMTEADIPKTYERGWTRDQFKRAFNDEGFTLIGFERSLNLPRNSVTIALTKRYPKIDVVISAFLKVPLHILWPNHYLRNGQPVDFRYHPEALTDEELQKLNDAVDVHKEQIVVTLPPGV